MHLHPLRFLLPDDRRGRGVPALFPQANTMKSPGFACRFVRDGGAPKKGPREFVPPGSFLYFHPEFGPFLQEFSGYRPFFGGFPSGGASFPWRSRRKMADVGRFCSGFVSDGDGIHPAGRGDAGRAWAGPPRFLPSGADAFRQAAETMDVSAGLPSIFAYFFLPADILELP